MIGMSDRWRPLYSAAELHRHSVADAQSPARTGFAWM